MLVLFRFKKVFRPTIQWLGLPETHWKIAAAATVLLVIALVTDNAIVQTAAFIGLIYLALGFYIAQTIAWNLRRPRAVIKLRDTVALPGGRLSKRQLLTIFPNWNKYSSSVGRVRVSKLFTGSDLVRIEASVQAAVQRDPTYRPPKFANYLMVTGRVGKDLEPLIGAIQDIGPVETAYVDPHSQGAANPADELRYPYQFYLRSAPEGIDAEYAWTVPGGAGENTGFIDVEEGWVLNDPDLLKADGTQLIQKPLYDPSFENGSHGLQVLGVMMAQDNTIGCIGVAHKVSTPNVVAFRSTDGAEARGRAICQAAVAPELQAGDVLVLPIQTAGSQSKLPVEIAQLDFEGIRLAIARGITVVEAAGNGIQNLNAWSHPDYRVLNPSDPRFQDSGAIVVGGGDTTAFAPSRRNDGSPNDGLRLTPQANPGLHNRIASSNFGDRVDCYAWGRNVVALEPSFFDGTSSATAIIGGVVLSVQGIVKALGRPPLMPRQMRSLLKYGGTLSGNPALDKIGVMPDLRAIANYLQSSPHLYVRDCIGDQGKSHALRFVFSSPDIIVRQVAVADPILSFGEGSGHEDDTALNQRLSAGQAHSVYVRIKNDGLAIGAGTLVLYEIGLSTIPSDGSLRQVGKFPLTNVPTGARLHVCGPYAWTPNQACCGILATLDTPDNPAMRISDFASPNGFGRLLRLQENLAVRNDHICTANYIAEPGNPVSQSHIELVFDAPAIWTTGSASGSIQLDVYSDLFDLPAPLPSIWLEGPSAFGTALPDKPPNDDGNRCWIQITSNRTFPAVPWPGSSRLDFRILIEIPSAHPQGTYRVEVQQLDQTELIGAIAWTVVST